MNHTLLTLCVAIVLVGCATGNSLSVREKKADIYFNAGTEDLRAGRNTEALSSLLQAVKLMPDSPNYWNNLGLAYNGKKEFLKAEESWKKALSVDSEFTDAKVNLGSLYLNQKKLRESELLFRDALKDLVYPHAAQIHYNLSLLYSQWKKAPLVEQQLRLAVKNNDSFCPAWYLLAKIEKDRGDFVSAEKSFTKAVSGTCFNNPEVHYEISSLHLKNKEMVKAKAKLIEIIQLFPQSDWAKKAEITLNMIR
jgi:type IV pilus assembly protein PilF